MSSPIRLERSNVTHYKQGAIECIDALYSALGPTEFVGFCRGNVIKYMWRLGHKNGTMASDVEKAIDYCNFILEALDKEHSNVEP